jgi:hypothetical protein
LQKHPTKPEEVVAWSHEIAALFFVKMIDTKFVIRYN